MSEIIKNKFIQKVKYWCTKNYKILWIKVKEDLNKQKGIPYSWICLNIIKTEIIPKQCTESM